MAVFQLISRSFGWLEIFKMRKAVYTKQEEAAVSTDGVLHESWTMTRKVRLIGNGIKLPHRLDADCYQELLAAVQQVYPSNGTDLVLDLSDLEELELSGIFALHCVGLMMRGETTPDPAYGWSAMRAAAERNLAAGRQENLKLSNPSPRIEAQLRANHFDRCVTIESRRDPGQRLSLPYS